MGQPAFETLLYDVADGVATITLNRPDRLNAFTPKMMLDMIAAFDATDADDAVKAVIVTGAGRGFCAGADLGSGSGTFDQGAREAERRAAGAHRPVQAPAAAPAATAPRPRGLQAVPRGTAPEAGRPLHGLRHPVLSYRLPAGQPHPRL